MSIKQGLDGQGAMNIVRLLRRLADHGQAIICTIHQANQEQFELVSSASLVINIFLGDFLTIYV